MSFSEEEMVEEVIFSEVTGVEIGVEMGASELSFGSEEGLEIGAELLDVEFTPLEQETAHKVNKVTVNNFANFFISGFSPTNTLSFFKICFKFRKRKNTMFL